MKKKIERSCDNCKYKCCSICFEKLLKEKCCPCGSCIYFSNFELRKPKPESNGIEVKITREFTDSETCFLIEDQRLNKLIPKGQTRKFILTEKKD